MGKFDDMARILTTARKRHDIRIRKEAEKNRIYPMCGSVKESTLPITVQVNGKLISKFIVDVNTNDETIRHLALADEYVKKFIEGKTIRKIIVAKRKLVNIIV